MQGDILCIKLLFMQYIVIILDGAADYPMDILGGKTPLEAADTPFMDSLAKKGVLVTSSVADT